jgi:hypothetical protein
MEKEIALKKKLIEEEAAREKGGGSEVVPKEKDKEARVRASKRIALDELKKVRAEVPDVKSSKNLWEAKVAGVEERKKPVKKLQPGDEGYGFAVEGKDVYMITTTGVMRNLLVMHVLIVSLLCFVVRPCE